MKTLPQQDLLFSFSLQIDTKVIDLHSSEMTCYHRKFTCWNIRLKTNNIKKCSLFPKNNMVQRMGKVWQQGYMKCNQHNSVWYLYLYIWYLILAFFCFITVFAQTYQKGYYYIYHSYQIAHCRIMSFIVVRALETQPKCMPTYCIHAIQLSQHDGALHTVWAHVGIFYTYCIQFIIWINYSCLSALCLLIEC